MLVTTPGKGVTASGVTTNNHARVYVGVQGLRGAARAPIDLRRGLRRQLQRRARADPRLDGDGIALEEPAAEARQHAARRAAPRRGGRVQRQQAGRRLVADAGQGCGAVHDSCVDPREAAAHGIHCGLAPLHVERLRMQRYLGCTEAAQILLSREAFLRFRLLP